MKELSVADEQALLNTASNQLEAGLEHKKNRMEQVRKIEEMYLGKTRPALSNRFNVPFDSVVMNGFIDTILSRSDDPPKMEFRQTDEQFLRGAKKVTAAWERDSSSTMERWAQKDRLAKKLAFLSGRAIYKIWAESDPEYKHNLQVVDHFDFVTEPGGGAFLDNHLFAGQINLFKTKTELDEGQKEGLYRKDGVAELLQGTPFTKEYLEAYQQRSTRLTTLGLDASKNYVGETIFNLTEWVMNFKGERYYLVFEPKQKVIIRLQPLKEVFKSGLMPWVSWASHDHTMFWSQGYGDSAYPVCDIFRVLMNQMLENVQKRNWNMRLYDPEVITDPKKLLFTPDGLVRAALRPGMTSVANSIYELQTPNTTNETLAIMNYVNAFIGEKTGVSPATQGTADEQKVGIYFGNLQQVSERFGLLNKQYVQGWADLGLRYDWGLYEHLPEKFAVKLIGLKGVEWDEIKKEDTEPDYTVSVVSTNAEAQENEMKSRKQAGALAAIQANPVLFGQNNPKWINENILRSGGFGEEDIRLAMDTQNEGNQEVMARAAEAIAKIEKGERPKLFRGATTGFIQKIIDWAADKWIDDQENKTYEELMAYANAHMQIATENMTRKAVAVISGQGGDIASLSPPGQPGVPPQGQGRTPSIPPGPIPPNPNQPNIPSNPTAALRVGLPNVQ